MGKNKIDANPSPRKRLLPVTKSIVRSRPTSTVTSVPTANIKVVVRVRPPNDKEESSNFRNVIQVMDEKMLIFDPQEESQQFFYHGVLQRGRDLLKRPNKNMQFLFDRVFDQQTTNDDIFKHSTQELISSLMDGYNCSVFVYGATGAGKTFTMLGHTVSPGITMLTMNELFKHKEQLSAERDFELAVTYLEVYNENVQDLLNPGASLNLREDGQYGVRVQGIQIKRIEQPSELFELLERGNKNRTQHPTDANAESSRSHAVFQVYVRMKFKTTGQIRISKLSMIDLAGSERGAATGCTGARFTEGANINKSLLALGNCINGLADGLRHIPYRDSKLTRLLKDSLGGNCQTVMIANISPSSLSYEDTYNTLKYANRAKKIKANIKKNVVNCESHIGQYIKRVEELNKEVAELKQLLKLKNSGTDTPGRSEATTSSVGVNEEKVQEILKAYRDYTLVYKELLEMQTTANVLELKCKIKSEANVRLNNFCSNTPDREKGNRRLDIGFERLNTEAEYVQQNIQTLNLQKNNLRNRIEKLLSDSPELAECAEKEEQKVAQIETQHKIELLQKEKKIHQNELEVRGSICDKMAQLLPPCYLLLRGSDAAPDNIIRGYKTLLRFVQGIGGVSWHDDNENEEPESSTGNTTIVISDENRPVKRKYVDDATPTEQTFIRKQPTKQPLQLLSAGDYLSKVNITPQPAKKMAKVLITSPRLKKENRRQVGTMGTSQRFPSATDLQLRKLGKSLSKSANIVSTTTKSLKN